MTSTFFGFETARRAMAAQQSALYTTGQNISNANTEGYSRQRVAFSPSEPFPSVGRNRPNIPGQVGTGVNSDQIERVRNKFLDTQYRQENTKTGFYEAKSDDLSKLEEIMNEPSDSGLSNAMNQFWQSLQDLSSNPTDAGTRAVVRERGTAVTETFHYLSNSIEAVQSDTKQEINIDVDQINTIATQINAINSQIEQIEINGYTPNDLYDNRDLLLDQLSKYVDIKTSNVKSGGLSQPGSEGKVTIEIPGLGVLVDGSNTQATLPKFNVLFDGVNGSVKTISLGGTSTTADTWSGNGSLKAHIQSFGYEDSTGKEVGTFPDMMNELDNLAYTFAAGFNAVHQSGLSLIEINSGTDLPINFFEPDTSTTTAHVDYAKNIRISTDVSNNLDYIAAAENGTNPQSGDGKNSINLANVFDSPLMYSGSAGVGDTFESYYSKVIGSMAVSSQEAIRMKGNSQALMEAVQQRKDEVSSVSLDEEMANMVKFQHAYNAGARMMNVMDEMLDKVINSMGLVGR